ncbi:hypothetical protein BDV23DRAFT_149428 [Aspergillus alliaceus]|uniref:Myb-like domain-containing protein n=1 Tax=Petromyces alliaceus TaxID=209559 RepID=A0A5N7CGJ7_PETAA|nr:hypothetical protein BDV23DRAFT_149428 [Aspergillus alliaceus]
MKLRKANHPAKTPATRMSLTDFEYYSLDMSPVNWSELQLSMNLFPEGGTLQRSGESPKINSSAANSKMNSSEAETVETVTYSTIDTPRDKFSDQISNPPGTELQSAELPLFPDQSGTERSLTRCDRCLGFEDELLLILRDSRGKKWQEISAFFEHLLGKRYRAPALQMRYMRLQKRLRLHTDEDKSALFQAHAHWADMNGR